MKRFDWWLCAALVLCCLPLSSGDACAGTSPQDTFLLEDTWQKTEAGVTFITPAGWRGEARKDLFLIGATGIDASMALYVGIGISPDQALSNAWKQYSPSSVPVLRSERERPIRNGWATIRSYTYQSGKGDEYMLRAQVLQKDKISAVVIIDAPSDVMYRREAQFTRFLSSVRPPDFVPDTLASRTPRDLDEARTAELLRFVDDARIALDIPGLAFGVVQDGEVKFSGGFGVRRKGDPEAVDASTLFLTASVTKPLTSLMLAKLVDQGRLSWDATAVEVLPQVRIADPSLRRRLKVRHLLCACTGIPAQDMEWIFSGNEVGPTQVLDVLATIQPTARPGELYQYSNLMAVVGGYLGGHVAHPELPLDQGYDLVMQELVFDPLAMSATTFDFDVAMSGNYASPHGVNIDGITEPVPMGYNLMSVPMRPDGGAWSSIEDLVRYLRMELSSGALPDGGQYIGREALHERLRGQVARGGVDQWYGMGLKTDRRFGVLQAVHGGSMAGYQAEVFWLPEQGAGYVLLTNADAGAQLRAVLSDRFMELLFDVDYGARGHLQEIAAGMKAERKEDRGRFRIPMDSRLLTSLAPAYTHPMLGRIDVAAEEGRVWFDFGGWGTEVAATSGEKEILESISASVAGLRFTPSHDGSIRALVLDDGQRSYTFRESAPSISGSNPISPRR
jgi:CubicO group peptidase (beta-lactamase class C family)